MKVGRSGIFFFKCGKEWEEGGRSGESGEVWVGLIKLRKEQGLRRRNALYCFDAIVSILITMQDPLSVVSHIRLSVFPVISF